MLCIWQCRLVHVAQWPQMLVLLGCKVVVQHQCTTWDPVSCQELQSVSHASNWG